MDIHTEPFIMAHN